MKRYMLYTIIVVLAIVFFVSVIMIIKNNDSIKKQATTADQSDTNVPNKNQAISMTDDQLVLKTISGEEALNLNNAEEDSILSNIDSILNEKDPLPDMPGE
jgi:LAS superfamily LD-carboxypeptidase LdcB